MTYSCSCQPALQHCLRTTFTVPAYQVANTAQQGGTGSWGHRGKRLEEDLLLFTFRMLAFLLGCAWWGHDGHYISQSGADHHHLASFAHLVVTEGLVILHQSCNHKHANSTIMET